jgi:hypothetical protein
MIVSKTCDGMEETSPFVAEGKAAPERFARPARMVTNGVP